MALIKTYLPDGCAVPRIAQQPSTTFSDQLQNLISQKWSDQSKSCINWNRPISAIFDFLIFEIYWNLDLTVIKARGILNRKQDNFASLNCFLDKVETTKLLVFTMSPGPSLGDISATIMHQLIRGMTLQFSWINIRMSPASLKWWIVGKSWTQGSTNLAVFLHKHKFVPRLKCCVEMDSIHILSEVILILSN